MKELTLALGRIRLADYYELTKPGIAFLAAFTTAAGFYLGTYQQLNVVSFFHTLLGTVLVAAGSGTLNQFIEVEADAKMRRTERRPLPAGRIPLAEALSLGTVLSVVGILYLAVAVNFLTSFLAALTLGSYLFIYTPLKKITSLSTIVGAIPGAIPPMMGWTAVRNEITVEAWVLFAILFFWQIPHFLAIAWMYRNDYARGGFPMLPVIDPDGGSASRQIVAYCMALVPVSLMPTVLGLTGAIYFFSALLLGLLFLSVGVGLALFKSNLYAKRLLLASICYIPLLLGMMMADKLTHFAN
jgi:protoheme IX farnesyltransferase